MVVLVLLQMRELVQSFCQSRYGQCLQQLSELRPELELDLHLAEHVPALTAKVRDRCLLQVRERHETHTHRGTRAGDGSCSGAD